MTNRPTPCHGNEPWHGTITGYNRHRCRQPACRAAARAATAEARQRRLALRVERGGRSYAERDTNGNPLPHGDASTYQNWGCRCEPCTAANTSKGRTP